MFLSTELLIFNQPLTAQISSSVLRKFPSLSVEGFLFPCRIWGLINSVSFYRKKRLSQKMTRNNHFLPFAVISTKSHGVVASDEYSASSSPELVCVSQDDFIVYFIKFVQPPYQNIKVLEEVFCEQRLQC